MQNFEEFMEDLKKKYVGVRLCASVETQITTEISDYFQRATMRGLIDEDLSKSISEYFKKNIDIRGAK